MANFKIISLIFLVFSSPAAQASFWDQVPGISQVKSAIQWVGGDSKGAAETQENFTRGFFLPAPAIRSIVEASNGDTEAAKETWKQTGSSYNAMVDSVPVVGHVKGGIHYANGDSQGGDNAMKSASRTTGVMVGGTVGFVAGGPAGAAVGGIAGGVAVDGIITGVESAIHDEFRPSGHIKNVAEISQGRTDPGHVFDTVADVAGDGIGGYTMGRSGGSMVTKGRSGWQAPKKISCFVGCSNRAPARRGSTLIEPVRPRQPVNIPKPVIDAIHNLDPPNFGQPKITLSKTPYNPPPPPYQNPPPYQAPPPPYQLPSSSFVQLSSGGRPPVIPSRVPSGFARPVAPMTSYGVLADPGVLGGSVISSKIIPPGSTSSVKKKNTQCPSPPQISNSDLAKMQKCAGSKVGERCIVHCQRNHEPTRKSVECVEEPSGQAKWNLNGASCRYATDVVCRDRLNRPVDWFVLYKMPKKMDSSGSSGLADSSYVFLTNEPLDKWDFKNDEEFDDNEMDFIPSHDFGGWNGPAILDNTLSPLKEDSVTYAMYSDQPPPSRRSIPAVGHSKGVVAKKDSKGFYLIHSLPGYPSSPGSSGTGSWAQKNGQLFVCVSFNTAMYWNKVVQHVTRLKAHIYSRRNWTGAGLSYSSKNFEHSFLLSLNGMRFDLFSKSDQSIFQEDIYKDILSPFYGVSLDVLSWTNGAGDKLASVCTGRYKVRNVNSVVHGWDLDGSKVLAAFRSSQDHSKWAVSHSSDDKDVFCAADLNRMRSQMQRKGGAVCFQNERVVDAFRQMIFETDCDI